MDVYSNYILRVIGLDWEGLFLASFEVYEFWMIMSRCL